jgi:phosphoglycerate dehydrogenase-like enzyme
MHIKIVMTTLPYQQGHWERLIQAISPAELIRLEPDNANGIAAALERADVALLSGDLDERSLYAPHLRWIHSDHAGLNKSARPEVFERGLIVTSSAGRSSPALAEHILFFMLALTYNYPAFYQAQLAHQWGIPAQDRLRGLYGRTVGIIGMGNTGKDLAIRVKACGMRVSGYRRRRAEPPLGVDRIYSDQGETIDALLKESDFVVLVLPLSDATYHLIGERELALMKPSAFLINLARGAIVDEVALVTALRNRTIAGAGLDTFKQEPLPPDNPLWDTPNTLITPHTTPKVPDRIGRSLDIICENVRRYRANEPLLNVLTAEDVFTRELS